MNAINYLGDEVKRVEEKIRTQMALAIPHLSQVQQLLEYEKSLVEAQLALVRQRIEIQQSEIKKLSDLQGLGSGEADVEVKTDASECNLNAGGLGGSLTGRSLVEPR